MWLAWAIFLALCFLYAVMVVAFIAGLQKLKEKTREAQGCSIALSVIIPLRNEEQNIDFLLQSLFDQDLPRNLYEIIMVNDHSTDEGLQIAHKWKSRIKNLTLLDLPDGKDGKKQAVAFGVERARYSRIVFTDADCVHSRSWLSTISREFQHTEASMIIGPVMLSPLRSFFQRLQTLEHASLSASTLGACGLGMPFMASSANLAFDRDRLGFTKEMLNLSQSSGDDVFLLHNAKRKGVEKICCIHSANALVQTKPAETLSDFISQRARWASKAPAYYDWSTIAIALNVLIFNTMLFVLLISSVFFAKTWIFFCIGFVVKLIVDLPLLWLFLRQYREVSLLWVFLPLQLVYPFYITIAFALSVAMPVRWKK
jgi:cellulose synthase/poly-beta-1,6-N-acetylglucosamine synthase-like glycosyltransferase